MSPLARPLGPGEVAMRQRWEHVTFLHWPQPPELVARRLPRGLEVDTFEGRAWVGLVPFRMAGIGGRRSGPIPYLGTFPETNVRTYVIGPDGTPGVWFDSLDASRLLPVAVARLAYGLPYHWARMRISVAGDRVRYESRRWANAAADCLVEVAVGDAPVAPDPLVSFLTDRWQLFVASRGRVRRAVVDHPPWPLRTARLVDLLAGPLTAAGYPPEYPSPLVHYSPGVPVRVSRPARVA
jgi:uncharacterized protein YqjF (DUF2071 family)